MFELGVRWIESPALGLDIDARNRPAPAKLQKLPFEVCGAQPAGWQRGGPIFKGSVQRAPDFV